MDNHYAILNIAMDAPDAVVRAAYRVLAARYHPDRREGTDATRMQQVNAAYDVLSDPWRRAQHDAALRRQRRRRAGDGAAPPPVVESSVRPGAHDSAPRETASTHRRAQVARFYAEHAR